MSFSGSFFLQKWQISANCCKITISLEAKKFGQGAGGAAKPFRKTGG